ncbi:MAG TPA: DUF4386 domain-containing protein [Gammaproteobacteria bacterium]|jgi:hypothetical protein
MTTIDRNARIVGLWYLALVFIGPLRLLYIPDKLFVHDDAAVTAAKIAAHQTLFQMGIFVDTWGGAVLVFLTLAFWRLFKDVDRYQSQLLVITGGIMPGVIYFLNTVNDAAALMLVRGGDWLNAFTEAQRYALAYFFTRLHFQVVISAEVLWGIWLFPMGILILKSRWFPRLLGWWLFLDGATWILVSFANMFLPAYVDTLDTWSMPFQLGEIAVTLWFLIMGAKEPKAATA